MWLYTTPKEYIEDVTVVPAVDGTVQYAVKTTGSAPVHVTVLDADGNAVASAEGAEGTITIPEVHLWEPRPGTPYLYTLHITCGADVYDQTFGVRSIEVRGTQVLLNGKPLYFKGFCKHEDFTAHGRGFDPVLNVKDVNLIHWANANAVRTSHYPYAEEFYDLCDREGILVMDETPAVGIGGGAAVNPYKEYPLAEHHRQVLAEMIHRDKTTPAWCCGALATSRIWSTSRRMPTITGTRCMSWRISWTRRTARSPSSAARTTIRKISPPAPWISSASTATTAGTTFPATWTLPATV